MSNDSIRVSPLRAAARALVLHFKVNNPKRWREAYYWLRRPRPLFLKKVTGVIHVGANRGQERDLYAAHDLNVLWVEPIPEVFAVLEKHIVGFSKQKALRHLVTDVDDKEYAFHISNNDGQSSSIFELDKHGELWPGIDFTKSITVKSVTLTSLVKKERLDLSQYQALIMDTQGSELLVLKGAVDILAGFRFIKTEVADFPTYKNCCQLPEMDDFLQRHGFRRTSLHRFASKPGIGSCYNALYAKDA